APRPARLPNPKPTTIKPKDSRYERGTTGGQVTDCKITKVDESRSGPHLVAGFVQPDLDLRV
ncbi:hypothetical protein, partial [Pseudochelatococcus lubricantis]|uniref:hypothetical protein n=1 Tax=Pseudochelatococcus lubricantis TaxID=1538102 RepID=UPI001ABB93A2